MRGSLSFSPKNRPELAYTPYQLPALPFTTYPFAPECFHYCCPRCGDEWAWMYQTEEGRVRHQIYHANCPACGGGSLRLWGDFPLTYLSQVLLAREIDLILTHQENYELINHTD